MCDPANIQTISKSPSHTDYTAPCHCPATLLSKKISHPIVLILAFSLRRHCFQRGNNAIFYKCGTSVSFRGTSDENAGLSLRMRDVRLTPMILR